MQAIWYCMNALSLQLSVLDDLLERTLSSSALLEEIRNAHARLPDDDSLWSDWFARACSRVQSTRALRTEREKTVARAHGCGLLTVLTLPELVRGVLLFGAAHRLCEQEWLHFLEQRWREGSTPERSSILRWLAQLPRPERSKWIALEAAHFGCRAELEAIGCENPYVAEHFSTRELLSLVARLEELGIPLSRVEGLSSRLALEPGVMSPAELLRPSGD